MKQKMQLILVGLLAATQLSLASADPAVSATAVFAQSGYGAEVSREKGEEWREQGSDKMKKEKLKKEKHRAGGPGSDGSKGSTGSKESHGSKDSDGSKGSARDKDRDSTSKMERKAEKAETEDGRATPQGLEKQREKKAGQVQKELDKGSERGQEARQGRKKWWKFWASDEEQ